MKNFIFGLAIGITLFWIGVFVAQAQVKTSVQVVIPTGVSASVRCNNQNFDYSARCVSPVDSFYMIDEAHFEGTLLSGAEFAQYPIAKTFSKFVLEDAFWYIDTKGRFYADSDIQALSIHLTR